MEQQVNKASGRPHTDVESAPLLDDSPNPDAVFRHALNTELDKICSFYEDKEDEILKEVDHVVKDADDYAINSAGVNIDPMSENMTKARTMSAGSQPRPMAAFRDHHHHHLHLDADHRRRSAISASAADDDDDSDDDAQAQASRPGTSHSRGAESNPLEGNHTDGMGDSSYLGDSRLMRSRSGPQVEHFTDLHILDLYNAGLSLKKRAVDAYVSLCGLKSFIQLNRTGFSKILKKYDKTLDRNLRRDYMNSTVSRAYPFSDSTTRTVEDRIHMIEKVYADVVTSGDLPLATRELRLHLREHVVWERNTVWREMIGIERKAQAANVGIRRTLLGGDEDPATARRQGDEQEGPTKELRTPLGVFYPPQWLCSLSFGSLILILCIFAALLASPIMEKPEQQNCLAMLVFVSMLWATEVRNLPVVRTFVLVLKQSFWFAGNSALRHFPPHPLPGRCTPHHEVGRQALPSFRDQGGHRCCV